MMHRMFIVAAGIAGAAGVATAAGAAHAEASNLSASSTMFFAHAPVFLALGLTGAARPRALDYAGIVLLIGVALFCGDLLARQYLGGRLFPFAAPAGGFLMIAGWLALGVTGFLPRR